MRVFPNFSQTSTRNSTISSRKTPISCIGLSLSKLSKKFWATQELGSKSTLDRIDKEAHPPGRIKIIIAKP